MNKKNCLIIAEAGVNHNGDINTAFKLCDAAKNAGADVVKFQTYVTESIITKDVAQAEYQKENTSKEESQYEMLKRLELSYSEFEQIKNYCDKIGIAFASTGDTIEDNDFLVSLGVPFIKIGSGDIGNLPFLRHAGSKKIPIIMSTGMSTLEDVRISVNALKEGGAEDVTILHCTTGYPCSYGNVNLKAMNTLKNEYDLPVGYSDHTLGSNVAIAAVAMGASVIEKHITLDKNMEGPDHKASANPDEFKRYVKDIRTIECALGDGEKKPTKDEMEISKVVLKRIVAKRDLQEGQVITDEDICVKRCNVGVHCSKWDLILGRKAKKDYKVDEGIETY